MRLIRLLAGPFFIFTGTMHFLKPRAYRSTVPRYLPARTAIVYASGVAEIAGGAGLIAKATRRPAGWWLVVTLLAIFPANIEMALHPEKYPNIPGGASALWARLPFQGVFIAWVLSAMRR